MTTKNEQAWSNFIDSINSEFTKEVYTTKFKKYLEYVGTTDKKLATLLSRAPKVTQQQIINFIVSEKKRGLSYKSLAAYISAIWHFYEFNGYTGLSWKIINRYKGEHIRIVKDRAYKLEELRAMLTKSDERKQVIILLMASTGMRVGAIPLLKIGDLEKIDGLYRITVYAGTADEYQTYCTPECAMVINSYLAYRERRGEDISNKQAPLIREQFDTDSAKKPRQVSLATINYLVREILIDAGIRKNGHDMHVRHEVAGNHGFRKWYNTQMIRANVKPLIKEILLGHKTSIGLEASYYRPEQSEILAEYLKAIDHLTIISERKLKIEVDELQKKLIGEGKMQAQLDDIKERLERYERADKEAPEWYKVATDDK